MLALCGFLYMLTAVETLTYTHTHIPGKTEIGLSVSLFLMGKRAMTTAAGSAHT